MKAKPPLLRKRKSFNGIISKTNTNSSKHELTKPKDNSHTHTQRLAIYTYRCTNKILLCFQWKRGTLNVCDPTTHKNIIAITIPQGRKTLSNRITWRGKRTCSINVLSVQYSANDKCTCKANTVQVTNARARLIVHEYLLVYLRY